MVTLESVSEQARVQLIYCYFRRSLKSYFLTPVNGTSVLSPFLFGMGQWHAACGVLCFRTPLKFRYIGCGRCRVILEDGRCFR